jgi:hypothetical protein
MVSSIKWYITMPFAALSLDFAPTKDQLSKSDSQISGQIGRGRAQHKQSSCEHNRTEMPQKMRGIGRSGQKGAKSRLNPTNWIRKGS